MCSRDIVLRKEDLALSERVFLVFLVSGNNPGKGPRCCRLVPGRLHGGIHIGGVVGNGVNLDLLEK